MMIVNNCVSTATLTDGQTGFDICIVTDPTVSRHIQTPSVKNATKKVGPSTKCKSSQSDLFPYVWECHDLIMDTQEQLAKRCTKLFRVILLYHYYHKCTLFTCLQIDRNNLWATVFAVNDTTPCCVKYTVYIWRDRDNS